MDDKLKEPPIDIPQGYVFKGGGNKQIQEKLAKQNAK